MDPTQEIYFLTLNCQPRGQNTRARDDLARRLFESVPQVEQAGGGYSYVLMLMPAHLHGLFRFGLLSQPLRRVVSDWKRWTARHLGIRRQRDFFWASFAPGGKLARQGGVYPGKSGADGVGGSS